MKIVFIKVLSKFEKIQGMNFENFRILEFVFFWNLVTNFESTKIKDDAAEIYFHFVFNDLVISTVAGYELGQKKSTHLFQF